MTSTDKSIHFLNRNSFYVMLGQFANIVFSLVAFRFLTDTVSTSVFGVFNLLLGGVALAVGVFCIPLLHSALCFYPEYAERGEVHLLREFLGLQLLFLCFVTGAIGLLLGSLFASSIMYTIIIALLLFFLDTFKAFETTMLSAADDQFSYAFWNTSDAFLRPASAIIAAKLISPSDFALMFGMLVGGMLSIAIVFSFAKRESATNFNTKSAKIHYNRDVIRFALPLVPLNIIGWLTAYADRYVAAEFLGPSAAGIYIAIYSITSKPITISCGAIELIVRPKYFNSIVHDSFYESNKIFSKWLLGVAFLGVSATISFYFLQDLVAFLLLAEQYRSHAFLMPWIAAGFGLFQLATVFEQRMRAYRRTDFVLATHGLVALTTITSVFLLGRTYGIFGIAIACPVYYGFFVLVGGVLSFCASRNHKSEVVVPV